MGAELPGRGVVVYYGVIALGVSDLGSVVLLV